MSWKDVEDALDQAKSIAFDGCHKIYVLFDDEQTRLMEACGYGHGVSRLIKFEQSAAKDILAILREWYEDSCALRFISSVKTVQGDPNEGFTHLIPQFEGEDVDAS